MRCRVSCASLLPRATTPQNTSNLTLSLFSRSLSIAVGHEAEGTRPGTGDDELALRKRRPVEEERGERSGSSSLSELSDSSDSAPPEGELEDEGSLE